MESTGLDSVPVTNHFTVDVEDWFHILGADSAIPVRQWDSMESRVDRNTRRILGIMEQYGATGTFFVLGWVARRHPRLVREIAAGGHEIASHGFYHQLLFDQTPDEFRADISESKALLEDLTGTPVVGYRAPGFSLTRDTLWALDVLSEEGFTYDSSLFPAMRGHGGIPGGVRRPHVVATPRGNRIFEFPVSVMRLPGGSWPFSGGGYLRATPLWLIDQAIRSANRRRNPVVFYLHPREIDTGQPRLAGLSWQRRFKYYYGLESTGPKIEFVLRGNLFSRMVDSLPSLELSGSVEPSDRSADHV